MSKRQKYKKPKLNIHGNYKEITKGSSGGGGEAYNEASL